MQGWQTHDRDTQQQAGAQLWPQTRKQIHFLRLQNTVKAKRDGRSTQGPYREHETHLDPIQKLTHAPKAVGFNAPQHVLRQVGHIKVLHILFCKTKGEENPEGFSLERKAESHRAWGNQARTWCQGTGGRPCHCTLVRCAPPGRSSGAQGTATHRPLHTPLSLGSNRLSEMFVQFLKMLL